MGRATLLAGAAALVVAAISLAGCCRDPEPQIVIDGDEWRPDNDRFNTLARRYSDGGIWRGNGFQRDPPGYINQQQMACTTNGSQCDEWKFREANCHETTFGMCNCNKRSAGGKYCEKWLCKDLEADQFVCHYVERCHDDSRRRYHRRLKAVLMRDDDEAEEEQVDPDLEGDEWESSESQRAGVRNLRENEPAEQRKLSRSCTFEKECFESPLEMNENLYRIFEGQKQKFQQLGGSDRVWAFIAHNPSIWGWFTTEALCIVPGDVNYEQQQRYCRAPGSIMPQAYFREIEEEMMHCECKEASSDASHCAFWQCMEHKDGMFGVLFEEPTPDMYQILDGILLKNFTCDIHGDGFCTMWSGEQQSWKEADMSKCKCWSDTCESWVCDEYKLMAQFSWYLCGGWYLLLICLVCLGWCMVIAPPPMNLTGIIGVLLVIWLGWHGTGLWGTIFLVILSVPCGLACMACVMSRGSYELMKAGTELLPGGE